ncbi:helix-turn-helix domain-containing protein [Streptomyces chryseus]
MPPLESAADSPGSRSPHRYPVIKGVVRQLFAAELRNQYEAGASIFELSQEYKRAESSVYRLLREAGTTFRSRGKRPSGVDPSPL